MTKEDQVQPSRRDLLIGGAGVVTASALWGPAAAAEPQPRSLETTGPNSR